MRKALACVAILAVLLGACDGRRDGAPSTRASEIADGSAEISGTALDAATGTPIADVEIAGPRGARATSDAAGRFLLTGLETGDTGQVSARAADGRTASVALRPLRHERLEVVLHLRRP
jgi:hypothetical protein